MNEEAPRARVDAWSRERLESYFRGAAFVVLLVLAAVATFRLYFALEKAILTWLRPQWIPLTQAVFSLVVLVIALWLMRAWVIARAR